ncbi:MAG: hypothetical protein A3B07_02805 [Candidatus Yonathbacteria bacterium RIFCSPLOWO2_01_FULL_43_27]|uniref:Bacterial sugar transferase domain-containing protein n=1 Tax=Candidatus Yonathbacteria bacterium RIFCSPLOWO2_01_FULL_43_27 TaxID=1802726 RepID=A0A1G2SBW9_9BACT|nr:MAG: hypothetical protein A3B07_02805 [Candidatus Yonathbacteria bacterium RIFCSPLOWO2_01_FULL_43_27]
MTIGSKKEPIILFLGDIISLIVAFWLTLVFRMGAVPSLALIQSYTVPLIVLLVAWIMVFFVAGFYEKHALVFKKKILGSILNAQLINSVIAVVFFYLFTPYIGVAPKTILALFLLISTLLLIVWRLLGPTLFNIKHQEPAILIGAGEEMSVLKNEVNVHGHYNLRFVSSVDLTQIDGIDFKKEIIDRIYSEKISSIVIDLHNEKAEKILPTLYNLIFARVRFYDMHEVYEEVFARIPLSIVRHSWFLENISSSAHAGYDFLKRGLDIISALFGGALSLLFYPFVYLAIKLDDGGPLFITQERVGKDSKTIKLYKFRSMSRNETELSSQRENRVTRVGNILRKTRIDELPQLWNVLRGDLSLIGPRPELPSGVAVYEKEIPYYNIRHLVKPGLSGWAQLYHERHPHHGVDTEETRNKLSYDLYYIKNRSLVLDVVILLKTIKLVLSRKGV